MNSKTRKNVGYRRVSEKVIILGTFYKKVGNDLLVIGKNLPNLGDKVYDEKLREVGYVSNIFGRVQNFFILIKNLTNREFLDKSELYLIKREKQVYQNKK